MRKMKWLAALVLPLVLVSFLQSQSLTELAKKEKARRAALKGKTATVITTADIAKVKKRPAVETSNTEQAAAEGTEAAQVEGQAQEGAAPPAGTEQAQAAETETPAVKPAETAPQQPGAAADPSALSEKDYKAKQADLTKAVQDKEQLVDLLTLKMNSLYQELYSLDNLKSRELLQAQISDTYDKLLKAQLDAQQAAKDLETFLATAKKEETPAIWIK
jgi:hypothetical protein